MTITAAAAETCACARCGARVIIPDYRPAWIYDGVCMDCAAAPDDSRKGMLVKRVKPGAAG